MATRDVRPAGSAAPVGEVFLVQRFRSFNADREEDSFEEALVCSVVGLARAIELCDDWEAMWEDAIPICEVWFGTHLVHQVDNTMAGRGNSPSAPVAPGRYRWDTEACVWRLVGPV